MHTKGGILPKRKSISTTKILLLLGIFIILMSTVIIVSKKLPFDLSAEELDQDQDDDASPNDGENDAYRVADLIADSISITEDNANCSLIGDYCLPQISDELTSASRTSSASSFSITQSDESFVEVNEDQ